MLQIHSRRHFCCLLCHVTSRRTRLEEKQQNVVGRCPLFCENGWVCWLNQIWHIVGWSLIHFKYTWYTYLEKGVINTKIMSFYPSVLLLIHITDSVWYQWLVGLGVWFSLWVREVPGSNPGRAHNFFPLSQRTFSFLCCWYYLCNLQCSLHICSSCNIE